jgi:hypothetical protein
MNQWSAELNPRFGYVFIDKIADTRDCHFAAKLA